MRYRPGTDPEGVVWGGHTLVREGAHTLVGGHSDFGSIC